MGEGRSEGSCACSEGDAKLSVVVLLLLRLSAVPH
jgi:hypothetical protein